jgi:3-phosphoshikimate 1-carboxyvinyltransferase
MSGPLPVPPLPWPSDAVLALPGSKSDANRLLVAAGARGAPVLLRGVTASDDVCRLVDGLRTLGWDAAFDAAAATVRLRGRLAAAPTAGAIDCGNAGTALRFLVSLAAITPGDWTLTGDTAMRRRPIGGLVAAWRQLGVAIDDDDGCPPVRVRGGAVRGGRVDLDASASSQFASSLLLVAPALPAGLDVRWGAELPSAGYVRWTAAVLARLGAVAAVRADGARVAPGYGPAPDEFAVVGDWSSMGAWTCLEQLTGSRVRATNLVADGTQPDEALAALLQQFSGAGERTIDATPLPDQFPNLAVVAACSPGTTRLVGGRNLRHKESDRIAAMARGLAALGADVRELPDGLLVRGGRALRGAVIDPADDHRIAMAFALAGLLVDGVAIANPACVAKSYPSFWDDLHAVVRARRCVAVIGMRGAGKTTFARAFAATTGSAMVDTDDRFEAAHGPIAAFVAAHGWPAFRAEEERHAIAALQPGTVVSLGGGAIESDAVRTALQQRAIVVWLDAPAELIRARLAADGGRRPPLVHAGAREEPEATLARRRPLYAALTKLRLDAGRDVSALVAEARVALRALVNPLASRSN